MVDGGVAIMQPYAFPYLGYFSLVHASETFVFYDDVQHRPRGWIHRNRILVQGRDLLFSIPLRQASQNRLIHEIALHEPAAFRDRFLRQLDLAYRRAPCFAQGRDYVERVLQAAGDGTIADLARASVEQACALLGIRRRFLCSSALPDPARGLAREQRLVALTRGLGGRVYLNGPGGRSLYGPAAFRESGLVLAFVEPELRPYPQTGTTAFVPGLSIIDVLMHNTPDAALALVGSYRVEVADEAGSERPAEAEVTT